MRWRRVSKSLNVFPPFANQYPGDCTLTDTYSICDCLLGQPSFAKPANLLDKSIVQLGVVVCLALGWVFWGCARASRLSIFADFIGIIVGLRPDKQVIWTHTRRVVAVVQNVHSVWNRSVIQLPRNAMRKQRLATLWTFADLPITSFRCRSALPQPAASAFLDVEPEAFVQRNNSRKSKALLAAVQAAAALDQARSWVKELFAVAARDCDRRFAHAYIITLMCMVKVTA